METTEYDNYVDKSTDAIDIAKMSIDMIEAQIAEMDPDQDNPRAVAEAIHTQAVQIVAESDLDWDEVQIAEIDLDMPEVQIAAESGQAGIGLILFLALIVFLVVVAIGLRLPVDLWWLPRALGF